MPIEDWCYARYEVSYASPLGNQTCQFSCCRVNYFGLLTGAREFHWPFLLFIGQTSCGVKMHLVISLIGRFWDSPSVFAGSDAVKFFEITDEVAFVIETSQSHNLFDAEEGGFQ